MKLFVSFGSAFALHAAVATGVMLHRDLPLPSVGHATSLEAVEIEQVPPPAATFHDVPASAPAHTQHAAVPVHVLAVSTPAATATQDVVTPPPAATAPARFHAMMAATVTAPPASEASQQTFDERTVTERATCIASTPPVYPSGAVADDVELDHALHFELVVDASGRVVDVRALERAGHGFDEAAVAALRNYRFSPAKLDGQPVRVRMAWSVEFRLK